MIVGFTLISSNGYEKEVADYIKKVCILENHDIAHNIATIGSGVNVYSRNILLDELLAQPFEATPIIVKPGEYLVVSAVDFCLELIFDSHIIRLAPTEYTTIPFSKIPYFETYVTQGLIKIIGTPWILETGYWDDNGVWVDSAFWND